MVKTRPQKLSRWTIAWRVVICIILIPIGAYGLLWVWASLYLDPGRFDRDQMNAIVDVVREQQVGDEQWSAFQIDDIANPKAIRAVTSGPRNVWAQRTADGFLTVSIITKARGHLGDYGFSYSDIPLKLETIEGKTFLHGVTPRGQEVSNPGMISEPREKIDEHWWKVWDPNR